MKRLLVSALCSLLMATPAYAGVLDRSIAERNDDAEENLTTGAVSRSSSDLEMVSDRGVPQLVGLRFTEIDIPPGANITNAFVQFSVDEVSNGPTNLSITAETSANPGSFDKVIFSLSSRPQTTANIPWAVPSWTNVGARGLDQATPNLAAVVQEVVDAANWVEGSALVIFIQGTGSRVADSYSSSQPQLAPQLHIEFDGTASNTAPTVDAGADIALGLPSNTALLAGVASDDGLPGNSLTYQWTHAGGTASGTPLFTDANSAATSVSFSNSPGTFILRLESSDGELSGFDELTVTVTDGSQVVIDKAVTSSTDDAEERVSDGNIKLTSSDLELVEERAQQIVGMRFTDLAIPSGVTITSAYIQFTVDETDSAPTTLTIAGQNTDSAQTFSNQSFNISGRPLTSNSTVWQVDPWSVIGQAGSAQRSPDLSSIVQEIVSRPGWVANSAMAFIIQGSGTRVAESSNGTAAPILHIEFSSTGVNLPPNVNAGANQTILLPTTSISLNGVATDDGEPLGTLNTLWTHVGGSGLGTVTFDDPTATQTTAQLSTDAGTYVLQLTADDGALTSSDQLIVTLSEDGDIVGFSQLNHFLMGFDSQDQPLTVPSIDPAGVYYHPVLDQLFIMDSEINEVQSVFSQIGANGFLTTTTGSVLLNQWDMTINTGTEPLRNKEPTGITRCASDDHYYMVNDDSKLVYRYTYDGTAFTNVDSVSTLPWSTDPEGITCDPNEALLYVLGGFNRNILIYQYVENTGFVFVDLLELTLTAGDPNGIPSDAEGITLDPITGHLLLISTPDKAIYEFTNQGVFVNKFDVTTWTPAPYAPQGISVGTSSDNPDDMSVYIVDGGVDNDQDPNERDGRVYEAKILRN